MNCIKPFDRIFYLKQIPFEEWTIEDFIFIKKMCKIYHIENTIKMKNVCNLLLQKGYFPFEELPKEIQMIILNKLKDDIVHHKLGFVCKSWYSMCNSHPYSIYYKRKKKDSSSPSYHYFDDNEETKNILNKRIFIHELNTSPNIIHKETLYESMIQQFTKKELNTMVWNHCINKIRYPCMWNKKFSDSTVPGFHCFYHFGKGFRIKDIYWMVAEELSSTINSNHMNDIINTILLLQKKDESWKTLNLNFLKQEISIIHLLAKCTSNPNSIIIHISYSEGEFCISLEEYLV